MDDAPKLLAPAPALAPPGVILAALAGCLLLQGVTLLRQAPPASAPASAPMDEFSAERAALQLARVLGDEAPHPVGTPANAAVRERLLDELRVLGCAPEVHTQWAWAGGRARGAVVRDVVARLPQAGTTSGQPLLLLCHYDSVPAGPGASDDGMGVAAVLEAARALKAGPPLARPVLLVFTDGEEAGLLGARAFVRTHPLARGVGAVVNVEARGTSGPSYMFQTSPGNAWMVPLLARLPRPACSSLFPAIYEVLPNDTDLTVFLEEDPGTPPALNFACIGDVDRYHTPQDDLAHLSHDTLQHHGDNLLHLARGLAGAPLETLRTSTDRLVYLDLFGLGIVRWPEPWSAPLAGLTLVALLACAVRLGAGALRVVLALGAWSAALALSVGLAFGVQALLVRLVGSPSPWAASPLAGHLLFWGVAAAGSGAVLGPAARRLGGWAMWLGAWLGWSALGLLVALALPGACFTFVAPGLLAAGLGVAAAWRPGSERLRHAAWLAPALAAAALWLPLARGFEAALGLQLKLPVTFAAALLLGVLGPLLPASRRGRWGGLVAGAALGLASLVIVLASGPHSPERPQRVNVLLEEEVDPVDGARGGLRAARWVVESRGGVAPPRAMIEAGRLTPTAGRWTAPVAPEGLPAPELTVLSRDGDRVRLRLRSPRAGWALSLQLDRPVVEARVDGVAVRPDDPRLPLDLVGLAPGGLELELVLAGGPGPVRWTLRDAAFGLPASVGPLVGARPDWAVRSQQGDGTIVIRVGSF